MDQVFKNDFYQLIESEYDITTISPKHNSKRTFNNQLNQSSKYTKKSQLKQEDIDSDDSTSNNHNSQLENDG